jgi:hypothetical protein
VQYLTISAVILLRCAAWLKDVDLAIDIIREADRCHGILLELEETWRGAEKCASIVHELLDLFKRGLRDNGKERRYADDFKGSGK